MNALIPTASLLAARAHVADLYRNRRFPLPLTRQDGTVVVKQVVIPGHPSSPAYVSVNGCDASVYLEGGTLRIDR